MKKKIFLPQNHSVFMLHKNNFEGKTFHLMERNSKGVIGNTIVFRISIPNAEEVKCMFTFI